LGSRKLNTQLFDFVVPSDTTFPRGVILWFFEFLLFVAFVNAVGVVCSCGSMDGIPGVEVCYIKADEALRWMDGRVG